MLAAAILLAGCGYVGEPLPPALNIPQKITDLRVVERGDKVILEFTVPTFTTERMTLKLKALELRAGAWQGGAFNADTWEAGARPVESACMKPGPCKVAIAAQDWMGREIYLRVRAVSSKSRPGDWSDFAHLTVVPPIETPSGVHAEAVAQGVRLEWQAPRNRPGLSFRVLRRTALEQTASAVGTVAEPGWTDTATEYGKTYEYTVEAFLKEDSAEALSEAAGPVRITPEDTFPPAVPTGLTALAGPQAVELAWERNTESDFRGYRIYRATGGGEYQRIADLVEAPSYSDRNVEAGKQYKYAVSAVDQAGNESGRSKPVEVAVP
jgi:predicted phage tail protein